MPSRADMEAATPKCPKTVDRALAAAKEGEAIKLGVGQRCALPCKWSTARQRWCCPSHGVVLAGTDLAAAVDTVRAA